MMIPINWYMVFFGSFLLCNQIFILNATEHGSFSNTWSYQMNQELANNNNNNNNNVCDIWLTSRLSDTLNSILNPLWQPLSHYQFTQDETSTLESFYRKSNLSNNPEYNLCIIRTFSRDLDKQIKRNGAPAGKSSSSTPGWLFVPPHVLFPNDVNRGNGVLIVSLTCKEIHLQEKATFFGRSIWKNIGHSIILTGQGAIFGSDCVNNGRVIVTRYVPHPAYACTLAYFYNVTQLRTYSCPLYLLGTIITPFQPVVFFAVFCHLFVFIVNLLMVFQCHVMVEFLFVYYYFYVFVFFHLSFFGQLCATTFPSLFCTFIDCYLGLVYFYSCFNFCFNSMSHVAGVIIFFLFVVCALIDMYCFCWCSMKKLGSSVFSAIMF